MVCTNYGIAHMGQSSHALNATETVTSGFEAGKAAQNLNYQESHSGVANNITVGENATCPPQPENYGVVEYTAGYIHEEWAWIYWHLKLP